MKAKTLIFDAIKAQIKDVVLLSSIIEINLITDEKLIHVTDENNVKLHYKPSASEFPIMFKILIKRIVKQILNKEGEKTLLEKLFVHLDFTDEQINLYYKKENEKTIYEFKTNYDE